MTERTEQQSNIMAVDLEGRGFTDSQQLSLNSDMHNLFGYHTGKSAIAMGGPGRDETNVIYRTEADLSNQLFSDRHDNQNQFVMLEDQQQMILEQKD